MTEEKKLRLQNKLIIYKSKMFQYLYNLFNMALLQANNIKIKATGVKCSVQSNPIARMMYYLKCVDNVLPLNNIFSNISKYTNYEDYDDLSSQEIAILIKLVTTLDIRQLEGKCFFLKPQLCGNFNNEFYEIEAVKNSLLLAGGVAIHIQGVTMKANKIMVYNQTWVKQNYLQPLLAISRAIQQAQQRKKQQQRNMIIITREVDQECSLM